MTVAGGRLPAGVEIPGPPVPGSREILTSAALDFLAGLQRRFGPVRQALLARRIERLAAIDAGASPGRLPETAAIRENTSWQVAEPPPELADRRVEITGPAEPKMMINALNSGARVFMADLEDALSPTWANVVGGQLALHRAVRDELTFEAPGGKRYAVGERPATLFVRPRGWHLEEAHVRIDGEPVSASLFDAGLYLYWNARERPRANAPRVDRDEGCVRAPR